MVFEHVHRLGRSFRSRLGSMSASALDEPYFEGLEVRQLLDVTSEDFDLIRELYSGLNLSEDMGEYHIIEIDATELSETALRDAILEAGGTDENDLIVIRTTSSLNTITLSGGELVIDIDAGEFGSVTIVSLGDVPLTIDAGGQSRVLTVGEDAEVELAGLTLTGGLASETDLANGDDGGGIYNLGALTLTGSTVTANSADGSGGGIYNLGTLVVTDSSITENTADAGGGMYNLGVLAVSDSDIAGNVGGGIVHDSTGTLAVRDSTIQGHAGVGIAIAVDNTGNVTVSGSTLEHNGGGIVHSGGGTLTVTNSTISDNEGVGIAIDVDNTGNVTVTDSTLERNSGGGIVHDGGGTLAVRSSTIQEHEGVGIAIGADSTGNVTVTGSTLEYNVGGGIVHRGGGTLAVTDSTVSNNDGGGIYIGEESTGNVTVTNSTVASNVAGGILHFGSGALTVRTTSVIEGNDGGGIYIGEESTGNVTVTNSTVASNVAGGILHFGSGNVSVTSLASVQDNGVGIVNAGSGAVTVTQADVANNTGVGIVNRGNGTVTVTADTWIIQNGGGGIVNEGAGTVTVADSLIEDNGRGGIFNEGSGTVTVTGTAIASNNDEEEGVGIYNGPDGTVSLSGSSVMRHGGTEGGGGIVNHGTLTLTNSTVADNTNPGGEGGGLYNTGGVTITGSTFARNTALAGGGIYNDGTLTMTGTTVSHNTADTGGGVYNIGTLTMTGATVSLNTADAGGGVYNTGTAALTNLLIAENTASGSSGLGGGVYNAGTMTVTNATITKNTGQGLYGHSGTITLVNSIVVNHAAGDIFVAEASTIVGYNNLTTFAQWGGDSENNLAYDATRPLFFDAGGGNYRLLPESQAVNAGSNARALVAGLDSTSRDLANKARIFDGIIDIGAYECDMLPCNPLTIGEGTTNNGTLSAANAYSNYWKFTLDGRSIVAFDFTSFSGLTVRLIGADGVSQTLSTAASTVRLDAGTYYVSVTSASAAKTYTVNVLTKGEVSILTPSALVKPVTKLAAPKTAVGAQLVVLTWNASAGADGYWVEWYVKKTLVGSGWVSNSAAAGTAISTTIRGLTPGVSYSFRVYTTTVDGTRSAKYASKSAKTRAIPSPQKAKATAGSNGSQITVAWQSPKASTVPPDMEIVSYRVYSSTGTVLATITATPGTTSYSNSRTGLFPRTSYTFYVVAVYRPKAGGANVESNKPVKVRTTTKKATLATPKAAKAVVGDIGLTNLTLRWNFLSGATGFTVTCKQGKNTITVSTGTGGNATWVRDASNNIVGITITGLSAGLKYDFTVRATNSSRNTVSMAMKRSLKTTKFPATKTPTISSSPTASGVMLQLIQPALPPGVTGGVRYELYYTTTKGLKPGADGWTKMSAGDEEGVSVQFVGTNAVVAGLESGQTYYVYVRSIWTLNAAVYTNSGVLSFKTL